MKKAMWGVCLLALVITAAAVGMMPDSVPMHYNMAGEIDRWGSKYENFLLPAMMLLSALLCHCLIGHYEKKAARTGKEGAEAGTNAKVIRIVGVATTAVFTVLQGVILWSAPAAADGAPVDIGRISCLLVGVLCMVLGNFIPKTKRNGLIGVRTGWSMYNDVTWMKSNRFGGVAMILAGALAAVTAAVADATVAMVLLLVYILAATVATVIYAYTVYRAEAAKDSRS